MTMPTLSNILRRALGRPVPLRMGALRWLSRDRLSVCLHEPGETQELAELVVDFALTGVPGAEVHVRLADMDGDPAAAGWFDRHQLELEELWSEHLAEPYSYSSAVVVHA